MYMSNKEESKAIREMMKKYYSDFKLVRNSHGRGTAYGWIHVTVIYPNWFGRSLSERELNNFRGFIYRDIKEAVGRSNRHDDIMTDYFCENILLEFMSREEWNRRYGKDVKEWTFDRQFEKAVFLND